MDEADYSEYNHSGGWSVGAELLQAWLDRRMVRKGSLRCLNPVRQWLAHGKVKLTMLMVDSYTC